MRFGIRQRIAALSDWMRWRRAYRWSVRSWFLPGDLQASRLVLDSFRPSRVLRPVPARAPTRRNILVLAPHPDDEIIGPGGTLLLARAAGCAVNVLFLTTGRAHDRETRRSEAQALCAAAGFEALFAGGDADAIDVAETARLLAELVSGRSFDVLFLPFFLDDHDDHRLASAVLSAAAKARAVAGRLPREVWAYHVYGPGPMNCVVDISDVADRKRALIGLHASQMEKRDWAHFALGMNAVISRFLPGNPAPRHAEGFMVLPLDEYIALADRAFACGLLLDGSMSA